MQDAAPTDQEMSRAGAAVGGVVHLVSVEPALGRPWAAALEARGHRVLRFADAGSWRDRGNGDATEPDVLLLDLGAGQGVQAAGAIAELDLVDHPGVALLAVSRHDDLATRLAAYRAGARRYLLLPGTDAQLLEMVDGALGPSRQEPYRVLLVDDDTRMLELHAEILRDAGIEVQMLSEPLRVLAAVDAFKPDVLLLDVFMPQVDGLELAAVLREREAELPILFLSSETDPSQHLLALALGGDDFLVKPVQHEHLVAAVSARARRVRVSAAVKRRLETTLYEREREHLALDQHALVSITDRSGRIVYANERFCTVSGYSHAELLGRSHRILKSGLHAPEFYAQMWRKVAGGEVWQGEIANRRKDGGIYWVESTITPFMDAKGQPYQYVAIRTDISHVKAAEQALRDSEQRHRQTLECAELAALDWDIVSGELSFNERWAELRGRRPEDIRPHIDSWLRGIHPDDVGPAEALLSAHLEGLSPMF